MSRERSGEALPRWAAPFAAVALTLVSAPSSAAGFALTEQNASGLGSVFAGQAALADDASVVFFNPAGLTRLNARQQYVLAAHDVKPTSQFTDVGSCAPFAGTGAGTVTCPFGAAGNLGHPPGGAGGEVSDPSYVPTLYAAWRLPIENWWAGIGVNVPFGLETRRDPAWIGRFRAIDSRTRAININPALAFRPFDRFSIGVGLNAQRFDAKLSNAVSYRAVALASGVPALIAAVPSGAEGVATIKGKDWGYGWNLGIDQSLLNDALHVAVAYRSAIRHTLSGSVAFEGRPAALAAVPQIADGKVKADVELPGMLSLAAAWKPASQPVKLMADWTHTSWNSIQDLTIVRDDGSGSALGSTPLRLRNSWRAGVGAAWDVTTGWRLRAGFAHETSPVQDAFRTPRLSDSSRNWYGLGVRWNSAGYDNPAGGLAVDFGVALVRPQDASSALANQDMPQSPPQGTLLGSYASRATIIGLQLTASY
jgi:long-chain fatty acid transport protein